MAMDLEQFCKAIDIIVSERLSNLSFDTTMICTILDASDKDRGHYVVSDGTIRFDAYTNDTSYKENDQVRVSVLNGNFNERKFIEGPYVGDTSGAPVEYISPLGTALSLEENAISKMGSPQNISSFQIHTNTDDEALIWEVDISNDSKYQTLQENGIYNTITLSADFMTNLGDLSQGNYGLVLDFFIKKSKDDDVYEHKYITFDSSEMIGNPYSFEIYSHQEKKINIAAFGMISMIRLSAYEGVQFDNKGRLNEHRIENPFIDNSGNVLGKYPINIRNIKLGFGNDLITITQNSLQLYTTSPYYYNYNEHTNETNNKTFGLLWLNKTDTNEYLGYSDGVYDPNYDEITYRKTANQDSRLVAQMNKIGIANDEESLTLAANIAEAEAYMIKAYDLLTTDLSQVIQALGRQLTGAPTILEELNKLIKNWDSGTKDSNGNSIMNAPLLNSYRYNAQQATQKLVKYYSQILNYGYNVQNQISPNNWNQKAIDTRALSNDYKNEQTFYIKETDSISKKNAFNGVVNWDYNKYYIDFTDNVNAGIDAVRTFFSNMTKDTAAGTTLNGYAGIKDIYNNRAEAVIKIIKNYLDQIDKLCVNDVNILQGYKNKKTYKPYDTEATEEKLAADKNKYCIYWYQYEPGFTLQYDNTEGADNTEYLYGNFAGANWKRIPEKTNVGLPQSKQSNPVEDGKYYYVAQVAEDEYTTSIYMEPSTQMEKIKVIIFRNHEMISSNIIEFENRDTVPKDKKVDAQDVLRIEHDVDSQGHYQVYSAAYDLVNISDGGKMRQIKCYYDGVLSGDETLADSWLYWYIPKNATLLTYDKDYLVNTLGFITDADAKEKTEYSLDNYVYFAKKVLAKEEKEKDPETGEEIVKLDDTTRIFVYKIKSFYEPSATNNTILVKARIPGYKDSVDGEKYFTFSTFGNSGTKYTLSIVPANNRVGYSGQNGKTWSRGLNLNMTLKDADNNPIQMLKTIPAENVNSVGTSLNVKFIAPSSGRNLPPENYNEIDNSLSWNIKLSDASWDNNETIKNFIGILQASVTLYNDTTKGNVNLSTLYAVPYAANPQYYIGGPTVIVYNNQGTVSRVSEEPFKLFEHTKNGDKAVKNVEWKLDYYDKNGNLITNIEQDNIYAYMPKLNKDNTLTPAPLYFTYEIEDAGSGSQEYYPVAKCYSSTTKNILWSQPIIIIQNKYASAMLNNWDGTFTIDEANGTLMSTMLGAGKKTKNNTFEGVLIGDIAAGDGFDSDNASGIGIYGFNDGDQSFYFGTDGTAFLGKSNRGRILFNGNSGTISSASYQSQRVKNKNGIYENHNTAGMLIDLDDGFIDMLGTTKTGEVYTPETTGSGNTMAQANIHIDVKSPYFKIHSATQTNKDKHLVYIANNEYYIQTDDYKKTTFQRFDRTAPFLEKDGSGDGFKLDLKDSLLDAYNLKITSKNLFINSTGNGEPYFVIKSNYSDTENESYRNLMYVDDTEYYLQSVDFKSKDTTTGYMGSGMKLTMRGAKPGIEAYNFILRSGNTGAGEHRIIIQDKSPYFKVNTNSGTTEKPVTKPLAVIGDTDFYFQSIDFDGEKTGIKLSLSDKKLIAYSGFTLQAYKGSQYVLLDATARTYPLKVYGSADKYFQVNWDGGLYATGAEITGTINATGGNFSGTISVGGTIRGGTIIGSSMFAKSLDIGGYNAESNPTVGTGAFHVSQDGSFWASKGVIGGWNVSGGNSGFTNGNFTMHPVNGLRFMGTGGSLTVDKDGTVTIDQLKVTTNFELTGKGWVSGSFKVGANSYINEKYMFYCSGDSYFSGNVGIGIAPSDDYSLKTSKDVYFGSEIIIPNGKHIKNPTNTANIGIDADGVFFYGQTVSIEASNNFQVGANRATTKSLFYGYVEIPEDTKIRIGSVTKTLPQYVMENSGGFTLFGGDNKTAIANAALTMATSSNGTKLSAGGLTQPVYFKDGVPTVCTELGDLAYKDSVTASLVYFSNTTVTPPTDGIGVYTVSIPYTKVSSSSETAYTSGHRVTVYANKTLPVGYSIGGYEDKGSGWVPVGTVWASGEEYTKVTTSTSTSSVSGKVQVSVSASQKQRKRRIML